MLVTLLGVNSNKTTLAGTTKYTYDVLGQLIQENNHIYTYDRAGNRTSVQTDDRREIYSYDRGRLRNRTVERQQDPAGSQTYTYRYDAQGNTLSDGENTYLYDCLNRITEVKTKAGDIQKNHYDAEGLRSQMEENGKLVSFIYADREVITEEDEAGEHIRYIRGHELLASDSERARTYYHYACDEMGSITDITDCHGTVLNHYAYDAFGNRTVEEETVENRFGFAGEMMDAVTGQYYLRARFYNPVIARFLSEDTYYGDGLNLYAYCHNNPVGYVDPSGHEGLICSKKYGELKKKETEGGTLSEKEKRQIYEYEQNQKKSNGAGSGSPSIKRINVGDSGHHVPAVRKAKGRPFAVSRSDKTRPTIFSKGSDPGYDHWRLHDAERNFIGPRQGDFIGTDDELFDAYRNAYKGLDDMKVDVKSPNGTYTLGIDVTPYEAVDLIQNWLIEQGLY